jgi:4-hydroxythreonine-4-phosphate dehydrogenase
VRLGITLGDPAGVGPEILLRAATQIPAPFSVFGSRAVLEQCAVHLGLPLPDSIVDLPGPQTVIPGILSAEAGAAARSYVEAATRAALRHDIDAIVTLPVNKEAVQLTHPSFTGHTEFIAELCGSLSVTMMLASDRLIVTHVSTHVSLAEAIRRVQRQRILRVIELTWDAARRLRPSPRLAVAGLNPHAGEHGLFGDDDAREIAPAVQDARERGIDVSGPHPPDTLFHLAVARQRFEAIVCMYHDQGHIPMKLLDFDAAVNVTLGLPILRTSVDHGTAFDIAWQGKASCISFLNACNMALQLSR